MKISEGFKLRNVAGEMVVSGEGVKQINFNKLIALNSTAAFLWEKIEGTDFDAATMADLLVAEYEVGADQALKDAEALLASWVECGVVEA